MDLAYGHCSDVALGLEGFGTDYKLKCGFCRRFAPLLLVRSALMYVSFGP
jgi:hypothetical protein